MVNHIACGKPQSTAAVNSRHLQADCHEPGSAPEPDARQSSMGYRCLFTYPSLRTSPRRQAAVHAQYAASRCAAGPRIASSPGQVEGGGRYVRQSPGRRDRHGMRQCTARTRQQIEDRPAGRPTDADLFIAFADRQIDTHRDRESGWTPVHRV